MTTPEAPKAAWQLRLFTLFTVLGWALIAVSFLVGLFILAPTAVDYWGGNAKSARDAAEAGSTLLAQLSTLQATPPWLEPLTFLGVGSFMFGIALLFSSIPNILKNRGQVMSICFPLMVKNPAE